MIEDLPTDNLPLFIDLERRFEKTVYGSINPQITLHRGKPVSIIYNIFQETNPQDTTEAVKNINEMIAGGVKQKKNGQMSFTVIFKEGKIIKVINQYYEQKKLV